MAHTVTIDLPTRKIGKADVHFVVKKNGTVLGKLEVSKGALVWYPKGARAGHKIRWGAFDKLAREFSKDERRKPRR